MAETVPPKKKNGPQNTFLIFVREFKAKEENCGRFYDSFPELTNAAGIEWQKMSTEQRRPYELKKAEQKAKKKEKKYTSTGEDVDFVKNREEEEERGKQLMIKNINELVSDGNDYVNNSFFIAHVNHYCYCNGLSKHIPAEISIVRFSLQDGVDLEDCFHVILDTGKMPIGYRLAALTVSEESHLIPVPPHEGEEASFSEKNIRKVFLSMIEFLRKNLSPRESLPVIYVDDSNMDMAKDVFRNFHNEFDGDNVYNEITVYSLSYLFFVLRNAAHTQATGERAFPFPTIPQAELEKDIYDYVKGIACEYHNTTDDAYPHCSLSKCVRKAFIICDHTCYDLNIKLIPGRHIPKNAKAKNLEERPSSQNDWVTVSNSNSRPASVLSNEERNQTPRPSSAAKTAKTGGSTNNVRTNRPATAAAVVAGASAAQSHIRKPQTTSLAMSFRPLQAPDLNNDFPALGSSRPARPPVIGRGRGRILQNMANK